jgi:hypothetical protein
MTLSPVFPLDAESLVAETNAAREAAKPFADAYRSQSPYPHGSFDNFLDPAILDRVREELATLPAAEDSFDRAQERLKTSYTPERLPPYTRNLFYALNSRAFIQFLEELTGIKGLIPDPTTRARVFTWWPMAGISISMPISIIMARWISNGV